MSAVVFENIDIVFGARQKEALALIDQGRKRDEILKATNVVLGAAGVISAPPRSTLRGFMCLTNSAT